MIPALLVAMLQPAQAEAATQAARRDAMVATIHATAAAAGVPEHRTLSPIVLDAMRQVPRHAFVPASLRDRAYGDEPLPIGEEQTISQPYIVALMTHLVRPEPDDRVLEIGTGSGYQAAILSQLVREVRTIEIVESHARAAAARLASLGYRNVEVRHGDGYAGWPEHAPFDAIVVTAGADHIPPALVAQLKPGGRMVIPVGRGRQELLLIEKQVDGQVTRRAILPVSFVPFTRREGR